MPALSGGLRDRLGLVVPAFAKLNLALEVMRRRPDGYHDLRSVLVTIDWHDLVGLSIAATRASGDHVRLRLSGSARTGVPEDDANLAARAARAVLGATGEARPPLCMDVWLHKRLPHSAGLGGGSADAAAVLRAGATLLANLGMHIGAEEIEDQAARLGSDVPALLHGGASFVEGRGDRLRAIDCPALCGAIAVLDTSSTARVFAELQPAELRSQGNVDSGDRCALVIRRLTSGEAPDPADLGSSLEAAARRVHPRLDRNLEALRARSQSVSWHMTGSGGAVFALAQSWAAAEAAARLAREAGFPARAWRTTAAPLFGW